MNSFEVRKNFIEFFLKRQHHIMSSSSLIPDNDSSLLFVNAGMNQFKNVFLGSKSLKDMFLFAGLKAPAEPNAISIQKCLRAGGKHNDLENVGETPFHHTFFEMLGNFSFGAYFKSTAIALAWEFLTEELKLPAEHLWVSVHEKDKESFKIWEQEQKIPKHKIFQLGDRDNFWQMGETGPCGFCTEIHYFKGDKPQIEQLTEIWNLVFMEFYDKEDGKREKLSVPCVDTGMGLERLCSILQNKTSNYHTDIFSEIILSLEKASGCKYDFEEKDQSEQQKAFRVLADHSRAVCFLIADDVIPGNEKENYVLRRIIRRALYYSQKLHPTKNLLLIAIDKTLTLMLEVGDLLNEDNNLAPAGKAYLSLKGEQKRIQSIVEQEAKKFFDGLKEGKKQLEKIIKAQTQSNKPADKNLKAPFKAQLKASEVWNLYSTYGFPTDLTRLIAKEKGWSLPSELEIKKYIQEKVIDPINQKSEEKYLSEQNQLAEKMRIKKPLEVLRNKNLIDKIGLKNFLNQYAPYLVPMIKKEIEQTKLTAYEADEESGKIVFTGLLQVVKWTGLDPLKQTGNKAPLQIPKSINLDEATLESLSQEIEEGSEDWLVLDKTCFYPEGGGLLEIKAYYKQKGDKLRF